MPPSQTHVVLRIDTGGFVAAMQEASRRVRHLGAAAARASKSGLPQRLYARRLFSHPAPLCIDGHAYRRRRRNR